MKILYPNGKTKALTFSYDDNQIFDRGLIDILNRYDLKATFCLNSGTIGTHQFGNEFVTWEELPQLYRGHEVACHGVNHPFMGQLPKGQLLYEIQEDKRALEHAVRYIVRGMSYPFGEYSDEIIQVAETAGIEYSRVVESTYGLEWPTDFMKWRPTCHQNEAFERKDLIDRFLNPPNYMNLPLLFIWGHSFELPRDNSWSKMEELCRKLAGHDDVWYATNIQIKDYISAVRNLVLSVDQSMVYNPSADTVYIEHNNMLKLLLPGETWYV